VEIDSVHADPKPERLIEVMAVHWTEFGLGEDLVRLRETKLAVVEQCAAAARRVATDKELQPAYSGLFKIACMEPDHRVRTAIARQIGIGGEQAYRGLSDDLKKPDNIVQGNGNDQRAQSLGEELQPDAHWGPRERHAWQRKQQKKRAQSERGYVGREVDKENRSWFKTVMQAWLLPMLVESADMTGHKGSPWDDLEELIN
jgi:hypothetical protein